MKKTLIFLFIFCLLFSLCACGKDKADEPAPAQTVQESANPIYEVKITMDNLYDYFEYREYTTYIKNDNGGISNVQVSYGLARKDGYTAANSPKYTDTMEITFAGTQAETDTEREFFRFLVREGIPVRVESNRAQNNITMILR